MSTPWTEAGFETIAQLVTARTGLDFHSRREDVERAMRHAMAKVGVARLDEFARRLANDNRDWDPLIGEITVRETYFYRHPEHFALLRDRVLPALREGRGEGRVLRVWSAGCASGEEAYSLAMCLQEEGLLDSASVHGTDLCEVALAKARAGRYREWSLRGLDPQLSKRYLRVDDADTVVCNELREKVTWSQLNLAADTYPSSLTQIWGMDLIFCRNVLIYFGPEASRRTERGLFDALAAGGWLITGPCDPVLGSHAAFQVITTEHGLMYRKPALHEAKRELGERSQPRAALPRQAEQLDAPVARSSGPVDALGRLVALPEASTQQSAASPADGVRASWKASGSAAAMAACEAALVLQPLSAELQYLRALTLMDLGWHAEAVGAVRRCLYLDGSLLIAHFTLGVLLQRLCDTESALRAYRSVLARCRAEPGQHVALGDGVTTAILEQATARALAQLAGPE
jgi:chemotaxis protein methyltransferase CheR